MKEEGEYFEGLFQDQLLMQQFQTNNYMQQNSDVLGGSAGLVSPMMMVQPPWTAHHDPFIAPLPPPPPPSSYASFFNRRSSSNAFYDIGNYNNNLVGMGQMGGQAGCVPFGLQAELTKMTAQEIMDAKALAASRNHSEAERRRRERINNHLAKLRTLLPSTTKTDKASLLAEVIQHVKELKRQTALIADVSPVPTELDELSVDVDASDEDGKFVLKASLCCEDRSDLMPQIIKTLKSLRLRTLKAEMTTLGGRVKNVLFITGDQDQDQHHHHHHHQSHQQYSISSIQEALKGVMEKVICSHEEQQSSSGGSSIKRQRTNNHNNINIIQHASF